MTEIQHGFVYANGLRFHVARAGEGEKLALLLHGFPELWYSWRFQLPLLARLGYRAWAPDLRGYGETDRPTRMEDYAIETLLDDVAGLVDAAGAKSTLLVGHDWGGILAWYFAILRKRPLERLVVMNCPHPGPMRQALRGWRQRLRSWYVLFFQIPWLPEALLGAGHARAIGDAFVRMAVDKSRFPEDVLRVYRDHASQPGALTAMLHYYRALVRGGGARRLEKIRLEPIDVPTLLLWGEKDSALGKETTYGTGAYVRNLTLRYLPNVSHWVQQEAPELVNAMLEAWLADRPVPEAHEISGATPA
ncbi:MAG: hydrolase [Candidatus Binatia bacterium]|nr:MAG: hydrolase [Candidatus Binatia bacterium]